MIIIETGTPSEREKGREKYKIYSIHLTKPHKWVIPITINLILITIILILITITLMF